MELLAMLKALSLASSKYEYNKVKIYSDSAYVVNICNSWIFSWSKNGWVNSKGQRIENYEIIKELWKYIEFPKGMWTIEKISGHKGNYGNELADALATNNQAKFTKILKENKVHSVEMDFFEF